MNPNHPANLKVCKIFKENKFNILANELKRRYLKAGWRDTSFSYSFYNATYTENDRYYIKIALYGNLNCH